MGAGPGDITGMGKMEFVTAGWACVLVAAQAHEQQGACDWRAIGTVSGTSGGCLGRFSTNFFRSILAFRGGGCLLIF